MATLDWQLRRTGDATLVELLVTSEADTHIEIESNLQPVWPPRRRNRPAEGWAESGFEGTVTAGEPLVLGYASPDEPVEPPATIVETEPIPDTAGESPTPETLVRELGEAAPPRDAVPTPDDPPDTHADGGSTSPDRPPDTTSPATESSHGAGSQAATGSPPAPDASSGVDSSSGAEASAATNASAATESSPAAGSSSDQFSTAGHSLPGDRSRSGGDPPSGGESQPDASQATVGPGEAIDTWLTAVTRRMETAERLAAVETAEEARAAVSAAGGIEQVRSLCAQLETDRERLERIEQRRTAFGQRLAEVDVPLSALERLA